MIPSRYRVVKRQRETGDTVSLTLAPVDDPVPTPRPGQFTMVYAFGTGEVPVSVSEIPGEHIVHTIRDVGCVTRALCALEPGAVVGLRGPFGSGWAVPAAGTRLLIVGGGIGLAPLRPLISHAVARRGRYPHISVLVGARTSEDLLYRASYDSWRSAGASVLSIVDSQGLVTELLDQIQVDPGRTAAFLCGPEVMMRAVATRLRSLGVDAHSTQMSLERNMKCGEGTCGHCQLGPIIVCRDGPVVDYGLAEELLAVKAL